MTSVSPPSPRDGLAEPDVCPFCGADARYLEFLDETGEFLCTCCAHVWRPEPRR